MVGILSRISFCTNEVEVLWYIGVFTWPGFIKPQSPGTLSFSKTIYPHCCSRPRYVNGDPVGCKRYVGFVFACNIMIGSSARNAPLGVEIVHCKCSLEIVSNNQFDNGMLRLEQHPLDGNMRIVNAAIISIIMMVEFLGSLVKLVQIFWQQQWCPWARHFILIACSLGNYFKVFGPLVARLYKAACFLCGKIKYIH